MVKGEAINIAKQYISYLKLNNIDITKAYLFGSYVNGKNNKDSDVDLAIIISDFKDKFTMQVKLLVIRRKQELIIEPHPFKEQDFNNDNPFAYLE